MATLAEIVCGHGGEYLELFGDRMPTSHRRALADIAACRTEALGGHLWACDTCGHRHYSYHSCKNRSCPTCHGTQTTRWCEKREQEILPVPHFHVVFTLPDELRDLVRRHQKLLLPLLMRTATEALMTLGADPKHLGGRLAILAVLHTWSRTLVYHPHLHCLVAAGALTADGMWRRARKKFLVPVRALSERFRGRFMKGVRKLLPEASITGGVWEKPWVVYCKPTLGKTNKVLQYLGRYVHRIAITNRRIESCRDGRVTFRHQDSSTRRWKTMTLPAMEFLRRYLQHVLPRGLHKVRYYGLLSPGNRTLLRRLHLLLARQRQTEKPDNDRSHPASPHCCPVCTRGSMVIIALVLRCRSPPHWFPHLQLPG